ncbi:ATP synthase subunit beta [Striga asiatica]|uniref:ATP synthase subunit beta n=1 Tax=Striga asiatica TaxID=4170 RepID=A0A5A7NXX8_STRAF|nr:ATP synthase subunit beta [Striga asiatica]
MGSDGAHNGSKNNRHEVGEEVGTVSGLDSHNVADGSAGPYGPWMMAKTAGRPFTGPHKGSNGRSQNRNESSRLSGSRFEVLGEADGEASGSKSDAIMTTGVFGSSRDSLGGASKGKAKTGVDGDWMVVPGRRKRRTTKTNKVAQKVTGDEPSGSKSNCGAEPHVTARSSPPPGSETGFIDALRTAGRALSSQQAVVVPMESELDSSKHLAVQVLDSPVLDPVPDIESVIDPGDSEMDVASPRLAQEGASVQMTDGDLGVSGELERNNQSHDAK